MKKAIVRVLLNAGKIMALVVAFATINSACTFSMYQDEIPAAASKLQKW